MCGSRPSANGHIQATGRDARGRKQYRYHTDWNRVRDEAKYDRLLTFARILPRIRQTVQDHMASRGLGREKVLATVVHLLETTLIRVGNREYARDNKSYGLTTLQDRHVTFEGSSVRFKFRGKTGKEWKLKVSDRRISRIVRSCQELPGQHLFQYENDKGEVCQIASSDVNDYLREIGAPRLRLKTSAPGTAPCWQPWPSRSLRPSTRRLQPNATSARPLSWSLPTR